MDEFLSAVDDLFGYDGSSDFEAMLERIQEVDPEELAGFAEYFSQRLPTASLDNPDFGFLGNATQSGFPSPCMASACRFNRVEEIATFSALYSDQTILFNPFDYCKYSVDMENIHQIEAYYNDFCVAVSSILFLKPLIDRKIIAFSGGDYGRYCPSCFSKLISSDGDLDQDDGMMRFFANYINDNTNVKLEECDGDGVFHFILSGTSDLYEHGSTYVLDYKPSMEMKKFSVGEIIPKEYLNKFGFFRETSEIFVMEYIEKNNLISKNNIKNVFSSSAEMGMVKKIFSKSTTFSNVDMSMPFLATRELDHTLKVRENDWHHFENFRNKILDLTKAGLPGEELNKCYRSEVLPELIKIERIVESSRDKSSSSLVKNTAISLLSLSSAIATQGLSGAVSATVAALGAGHFAKSMVPALQDRLSVPTEIKDSSFYYAWKIQQR